MSILVALVILVLSSFSTKSEAKTDLVIEGKVLGYELYSVRLFTYPVKYPVLVKVTKIINGSEKSEYILILFDTLKKEFAIKEFGANKFPVFKLERQVRCDQKINNLFHPGFVIDENGREVETSQTFTLVSGVDKKLLPLKKKIPCYYISQD